nr:hypothetical protein [Rhizoctonia solani fusarivirus 4]
MHPRGRSWSDIAGLGSHRGLWKQIFRRISKWHLMGTTLNVSTMVNTVVRPATYGESVQVAGRVGRTRSGTAIILGANRLAETVEDWGMRVTTDAQAVKAGQPPVWGVEPVDVSDELLNEVNKWLQRHKLSDKTTEEDRMLHRLVTNVERVGKDSKYLFKMKNKIGSARSVTVTEVLYDMSKGKLKSTPLRTIHGNIPRPTKADNIMSTTVKPVDAAQELKRLLSPPPGPISEAVSAAYKGKEKEDVAPMSPSLDWALDEEDVTAVKLDWSQGQPPYRVFCKMGTLEGVIDPNNPMAQLDKEKKLKAQLEVLSQATSVPLPEGSDADLTEVDILPTSSEETVVSGKPQLLSWLKALYHSVMLRVEKFRVICSNFLDWLI